ncbi:sulfotransferase family protein [Methylophaga pinxianii]|uniref:sulfotransferase family protein n=1 Tax=Methylophaga pinxianii TaxID=2881052 RepID=UPI001CF10031|nr:sulfotransferase domain-containing protein [Methylophaga pinxianii]MCB2428446.1 sulfotransferase domain-containing protein [Methylophaga pinxianii]UPH45381.1 sulfotransferase domain-containing protein [Methylophaga pinxianii]
MQKTNIHGNIDHISATNIAGWITLDSGLQTASPLRVEILLDNNPVAVIPANIFRADVKAAGYCGGYCGFRYDFNYPLSKREQSLIKVKVIDSDFSLAVPDNNFSAANVKPNFFIVGAPKCGTTFLYYYLKQHPQIFFPRIKEPNFFAKDLDIQTHPSIRSLNSYHGLFEDGVEYLRKGDASQFHLYSREAAQKIFDFNSDAKIIISLRPPLELMWSLYQQYRKTNDEDIISFAEALELSALREKGISIPRSSLFPKCMSYVSLAMYYEQVKRYTDVFPLKNIHFLLLEDLAAKPELVLENIDAFLNINVLIPPKLIPQNSSKSSLTTKEIQSLVQIPLWIKKILNEDIYRLSEHISMDLKHWQIK